MVYIVRKRRKKNKTSVAPKNIKNSGKLMRLNESRQFSILHLALARPIRTVKVDCFYISAEVARYTGKTGRGSKMKLQQIFSISFSSVFIASGARFFINLRTEFARKYRPDNSRMLKRGPTIRGDRSIGRNVGGLASIGRSLEDIFRVFAKRIAGRLIAGSEPRLTSGEKRPVDFLLAETRSVGARAPTLESPRMYAYIHMHRHTRSGASKAPYFTGTVAISVNTIKPSAHVRRLRQSRVWNTCFQEGHTLFTNDAERKGGWKREGGREG